MAANRTLSLQSVLLYTLILSMAVIGYYAIRPTFAHQQNDPMAAKQAENRNENSASVSQEALMLEYNGIDDLKSKLTDEQYNVCFLKGTEPPGSGKYYHFNETGEYHCVVCNEILFRSDTKYDSGSGWPAFWDVADSEHIKQVTDNSLGIIRTEVQCANCGAHLGHVFSDGPPPTGLRYCINSLAMEFKPLRETPQSEIDDKSD